MSGIHSLRSFPAAIAASLAAGLVAGLAACGGPGTDEAAASSAVITTIGPEGIAIARVTGLDAGPQLSGALSAERTAQLRAEVPGSVVEVLHDPGDRVAAGTVLARIDDRAVRDAWLSARAGVTAAQAGAEVVRRDLARTEKLAAAGAVADRDLENARRASLLAESALEDAKARLAAAQKNLDATVVKAPYAGAVADRSVNPGDVVSPGAPLFTVVDPGSMRLEAAIPASQLGAVKVGQVVRFTVTGYPGRSFTGTVSQIAAAADAATRQVRVWARIPNAGGGLVAGLFADGRVATESRDALAIPTRAVDQRGLTPAVLRLKGGKVEKVEVQLGTTDEGQEIVEVVAGLAAGDTVMVGAAQGITPGTPVKVGAPSDATAGGAARSAAPPSPSPSASPSKP